MMHRSLVRIHVLELLLVGELKLYGGGSVQLEKVDK